MKTVKSSFRIRPFLLHTRRNDEDEMAVKKESANRTALRRRKPPPVENDLKKSMDDEKPESTGNSAPIIPEEKPHPDEHQIKLDTDRSFVLYSVGSHTLSPVSNLLTFGLRHLDDDSMSREEMQAMLNVLITSVFRRRPNLSYFQVSTPSMP